MSTALDMLTNSLQKIGVYAPGETITAADAQLGLGVLNDMLDSWSNESLTCFAIKEYQLPLQAGVSSYTVGPGGVLNATRPIRVIVGPGAAYLQDTNLNNYPVNVVPQDQWNLIGTRAVNSNIPDTLFYDPQFPLGILNVFPTPNINYNLFFDTYLQLVEFTSLNQVVQLPPGYKKAIQDNLAIELKPYFADAEVSQLLIEIASKSKGNIKRSNIREVVALYDSEIVSRAQGSYNIYSDRSGSTGST